MLRIVSVVRPYLPPVTGTPIQKTDANTRTVFGDYISIYDIQRAVADEATKPIYFESRIAKLALNAAELPKLDAEFAEIIPQSRDEEEMEFQQIMMTKWAALEALVGDPKRIALPLSGRWWRGHLKARPRHIAQTRLPSKNRRIFLR